VNIEYLLPKIRNSLVANEDFILDNSFQIPYDKNISQVYISLFQEGKDSIRWGSKQKTFEKPLSV